MKLTTKIPLYFFALGSIMFIAVLLISWRGDNAHQSALKTSILEQESKQLIHLIDRNLFERYHDASAFSLLLADSNAENWIEKVNSELFIKEINSYIESYKSYSRIILFDLNGNVVSSSSENKYGRPIQPFVMPAEKINHLDWFENVVDEVNANNKHPDGAHIIGPGRELLGGKSNNFDLIFAKLLKDSEGNKIGVWVNVVDFETVEEIVSQSYKMLSSRGFDQARVHILDNTGRLIVEFDPMGRQQSTYSRDFDTLQKVNFIELGVPEAKYAVSGLSGSMTSKNVFTGQEQITGYAPSKGLYDYPGLGWSALVTIPFDESVPSSGLMTSSTIYLGLTFLTLVTALALFTARHIVRPIRLVSDSLNRLAAGENNVPIPNVRGSDEIKSMLLALSNLSKIVEDHNRLSIIKEEQRFQIDIQRRAIESTATGVVVSDFCQEGNPIIYVNSAFEDLTGYKSEDILGRNCRFLQGNDTKQKELETLRISLENKSSCSVVLRNYKRDGTMFYNNLRLDPVFNELDELTHYIGIISDISDLINAEKKIKEKLEKEISEKNKQYRNSESRLRAVFDTSIDGTVILDENGRILEVNRSFEVIFGYIRFEVIGKKLLSLLSIDESLFREIFLDGLLSNNSGMTDFVAPQKIIATHKSGREFPIELSLGKTLLGGDISLVGVVRDIEEQQKTKQREVSLQNELREKEVIYRTAFSQAAVGIARLSVDGGFIEVNEKLCSLLNYSEKELLDSNIYDITEPDYHTRTRELLSELIDGTADTFTLDKPLIRSDSGELWVTTSVSLVRDSQGKPKYFIKIVEDITERKRAEQDLKRAKKSRDQLIQGMKMATEAGGVCNWSLDLKTRILSFDDAMCNLYGLNNGDEITYSDWMSLIHHGDVERFDQAIQRAIQEDEIFYGEFRIYNKKTGMIQWVKGSAHVYYNQDGIKDTLFGVNINITEERILHKNLERQSKAALQANEAKSRFLAAMSHEIRTPINGVIGMIDLLRESKLDHDQNKMVSVIRESSFSLLEIINDILDFSKIEAGQMQLEYRETDILDLVEKAVDVVWATAKEKNIAINIRHDFNLPRSIKVDSVRMRQILINLLGNAVKFSHDTDRESFVVISTEYKPETDTFLISVSDNGVGMSASKIENLFKPFIQADSSTTRKYGGTGLGLSITKSLVEIMGGKIHVESELDVGSSFTVELPFKSAPDKTIWPHIIDLKDYDLIVLVDDEALRRECEQIIVQFNPKVLLKEMPPQLEPNSKRIIVSLDNAVALTPPNSANLVLNCEAENTHSCQRVSLTPLKPSEFITAICMLCGLSPGEQSSLESTPSIVIDSDVVNSDIVILCAEDQPTNRLVLERQLVRLGYPFEMTNNGCEALEKWKAGDYPVVLTDCHMPEMDGFELTEEIRRIEHEENRPRTIVVAVTANALVGESDHCLRCGMDEYISKPLELAKLWALLERVVKDKLIERRLPPMLPPELSVSEQSSVLQAHSTSVIDYAHLSSVIGTQEKTMMNTVLSVYWESLVADMARLEEAVEKGDVDTIRAAAHAQRGSASSSGAIVFIDLFKTIEMNSDNVEKVSEALSLIKSSIVTLEQELINEQVIEA